MAKNVGMTNSASFFNGRTKIFDLEMCFNRRADSIKGALKNMKYIVDNPQYFTDEDIKREADFLADEFYTIAKVALEWEKKELKKG